MQKSIIWIPGKLQFRIDKLVLDTRKQMKLVDKSMRYKPNNKARYSYYTKRHAGTFHIISLKIRFNKKNDANTYITFSQLNIGPFRWCANSQFSEQLPYFIAWYALYLVIARPIRYINPIFTLYILSNKQKKKGHFHHSVA